MAYNHPVHGATNTSYNAPLEQPAQPARPFGVDANGPATNQPGYNAPEGTHGQHVRFAGGTAPAGAGPAPGGASVPPPTTTGAAPGGGYGTGSGTSAGVAAPAATTATTSTTGPTAHENTGERAARSVKGVFAQAHGIGESLRGNINSAIDSLVGDTAKKERDEETARRGFREVSNREFERSGHQERPL